MATKKPKTTPSLEELFTTRIKDYVNNLFREEDVLELILDDQFPDIQGIFKPVVEERLQKMLKKGNKTFDQAFEREVTRAFEASVDLTAMLEEACEKFISDNPKIEKRLEQEINFLLNDPVELRKIVVSRFLKK